MTGEKGRMKDTFTVSFLHRHYITTAADLSKNNKL